MRTAPYLVGGGQGLGVDCDAFLDQAVLVALHGAQADPLALGRGLHRGGVHAAHVLGRVVHLAGAG